MGAADGHRRTWSQDRRRDRRGRRSIPRRCSPAPARSGFVCPSLNGGKNWQAGAYSPLTNTMYFPLQNTVHGSARSPSPQEHVALRRRARSSADRAGHDATSACIHAISAETGETAWKYRAARRDDVAGRHRRRPAVRRRRRRPLPRVRPAPGKVLWEMNLGSPVTGYPITFAVDGKQYVAVSTGPSLVAGATNRLTPEIRPAMRTRCTCSRCRRRAAIAGSTVSGQSELLQSIRGSAPSHRWPLRMSALSLQRQRCQGPGRVTRESGRRLPASPKSRDGGASTRATRATTTATPRAHCWPRPRKGTTWGPRSTTRWRGWPRRSRWEQIGSPGGSSDLPLARVQFASALDAAAAMGRAPASARDRAAALVVTHQQPDGSWTLNPSQTLGGATFYGRALATAMARRLLTRSTEPAARQAAQRADAWLQSTDLPNVLTASSVLLGLGAGPDAPAARQRGARWRC